MYELQTSCEIWKKNKTPEHCVVCLRVVVRREFLGVQGKGDSSEVQRGGKSEEDERGPGDGPRTASGGGTAPERPNGPETTRRPDEKDQRRNTVKRVLRARSAAMDLS